MYVISRGFGVEAGSRAIATHLELGLEGALAEVTGSALSGLDIFVKH